MKFFVKVKTGAKRERVEKIDAVHFVVSVKERAKEGEANRAVEKALSKHFDVPKTNVNIVKGRSSRNKIIEV
ncbi:MAG: DUF167 domain-containing protein [Candidatus Sungiibacteriota bacterium]|uniref:DUF167 domain-containing protein n=1 Tax=Candidatus Sungiibacteriota bacterium TaxID=2750080 RepID=A0A7T5RJC1_9BACT|nr:MAG: DUF167 domain-containing protein [Candidatus Sungbacteria bacterium]